MFVPVVKLTVQVTRSGDDNTGLAKKVSLLIFAITVLQYHVQVKDSIMFCPQAY